MPSRWVGCAPGIWRKWCSRRGRPARMSAMRCWWLCDRRRHRWRRSWPVGDGIRAHHPRDRGELGHCRGNARRPDAGGVGADAPVLIQDTPCGLASGGRSRLGRSSHVGGVRGTLPFAQQCSEVALARQRHCRPDDDEDGQQDAQGEPAHCRGRGVRCPATGNSSRSTRSETSPVGRGSKTIVSWLIRSPWRLPTSV